MTASELESLLSKLEAAGAEYFRFCDGEIEIRFAKPAPINNPQLVDNLAAPRTPAPPLEAVPPTEMPIPHHDNQVRSLLRLSNEELVDKLFPDYSQVKPEVASAEG